MRRVLALVALLALPAFAADPSVVAVVPGKHGPTLHVGPSVSLYEMRLSGQVGQLAPGLGVQGWASWSSGASVGLAIFGSALGLGTAHVGAAMSVAAFGCWEAIGLCVGPGVDLGGSQGGLLSGFTWKGSTFLVAQVLPKFWELVHFKSGG